MQHDTIPVSEQKRLIIEKISILSLDRVTQVADFVDFISQKDQEHQLLQAAGKMAENTFKKVWDNSEDNVYDQL